MLSVGSVCRGLCLSVFGLAPESRPLSCLASPCVNVPCRGAPETKRNGAISPAIVIGLMWSSTAAAQQVDRVLRRGGGGRRPRATAEPENSNGRVWLEPGYSTDFCVPIARMDGRLVRLAYSHKPREMQTMISDIYLP